MHADLGEVAAQQRLGPCFAPAELRRAPFCAKRKMVPAADQVDVMHADLGEVAAQQRLGPCFAPAELRRAPFCAERKMVEAVGVEPTSEGAADQENYGRSPFVCISRDSVRADKSRTAPAPGRGRPLARDAG